jgi:hypothetical protein
MGPRRPVKRHNFRQSVYPPAGGFTKSATPGSPPGNCAGCLGGGSRGPAQPPPGCAGFNDAGEILVGSSFIREPGRYLPPSFEQDARHVLRRPHVMIPLDAITRDIAERMDASPDRTEANEENTVDAD